MTNDVLRPEVVERLRLAALDGMMSVAGGTSTAEVLSASLTIVMQLVDFVNKHSSSPESRAYNLQAAREALLRMVASTADESKVN